MNSLTSWEKRKSSFLARLVKDKCIKYFDEEMDSLVSLINSHPLMYTTSCCSGRISMVKVLNPWTKSNARIIGKWHEKITVNEIVKHLRNNLSNKFNLWILLQPPIIHVACRNLDVTQTLISKARNSGFKETGVFTIKGDYIMVEVKSSERLGVPLILGGEVILNQEKLEKLCEYLNILLKNLKVKIKRLEEDLKKDLEQ